MPTDFFEHTGRWHVEQGDCLSLLPSMPEASVDAIITDPPYSSGGMFRGDRMQPPSKKYVQGGSQLVRPEFTGDNRDQRSFGFWSALWLSECQRIAKPGAPICLFTDWRQLPTICDVLQAGGWLWRGVISWDKSQNCRKVVGRFAAQSEFIVWGSNGPMPQNRGVGCLPGAFRIAVDPRDKHHMTGKPTELLLELVKICQPGGLIMDPFCGSATTGVAALRQGHRFFGVEREAVYAHISRERLLAEENGLSLSAHQSGQAPLFGQRVPPATE